MSIFKVTGNRKNSFDSVYLVVLWIFIIFEPFPTFERLNYFAREGMCAMERRLDHKLNDNSDLVSSAPSGNVRLGRREKRKVSLPPSLI